MHTDKRNRSKEKPLHCVDLRLLCVFQSEPGAVNSGRSGKSLHHTTSVVYRTYPVQLSSSWQTKGDEDQNRCQAFTWSNTNSCSRPYWDIQESL